MCTTIKSNILGFADLARAFCSNLLLLYTRQSLCCVVAPQKLAITQKCCLTGLSKSMLRSVAHRLHRVTILRVLLRILLILYILCTQKNNRPLSKRIFFYLKLHADSLTLIPMLLQNALSGTSSETRIRRNMR